VCVRVALLIGVCIYLKYVGNVNGADLINALRGHNGDYELALAGGSEPIVWNAQSDLRSVALDWLSRNPPYSSNPTG
jgi:hypothetical protein